MSRFLNQVLSVRQRHLLFFWLNVLPKALKSSLFREQVRLVLKYYPGKITFPKVIRFRNWGEGRSLALSRRFPYPLEDLEIGGQMLDEVGACLSTQNVADQYFSEMAKWPGFDKDRASQRRLKTERLLLENPDDFFCEVELAQDGSVWIYDGHHRASIRKHLGFTTMPVQVAIKLNHSRWT